MGTTSTTNDLIADSVEEYEDDLERGEQLLKRWADESRWLPDDFPGEATVTSTEYIICQRNIERELVVEEQVETAEVSRQRFKEARRDLDENHEKRFNHVPSDGFVETKFLYLDTDSVTKAACSDCGGRGRLDCRKCSGGIIACGECGGRGRVETTRTCPRCSGSGTFGNSNITCGQCAGKGKEVIDDQCPRCRGRGEVSCQHCRGEGSFRCDLCEGDGQTVTHDIIHRKYTPRETIEHDAPGVPEKLIKDVEGAHVNTKQLQTSRDRPKHEQETREIEVVKVAYEYSPDSLLGETKESRDWEVFVVEDEFKHEAYPQSNSRRLLTVGAVIVGLLIALVLVAYALNLVVI